MTTVTVGDNEFDVDVKDESVCIVLKNYGRMSVHEFSCEGLYVLDGDKPVLLHDYLIAQAIELSVEE